MRVLQFFWQRHLRKHQSAEPALEEVCHDGTEHCYNVAAPGDRRQQTISDRVHCLDGKEKARPKRQYLLPLFVSHSTINRVEEARKKEVENHITDCHYKEQLPPRQVAKKEE